MTTLAALPLIAARPVPIPLALLALFQPSAGGASALYPTFLMYGAIFAIFYFVLMRPQQQQRKKHEEEIRNVKKGDRIVTSGGIIGEVIFLKDEEITIRSGESRLVIERGRIARIATPTAPADGA
jgi:preprotein translocase subunit YajC